MSKERIYKGKSLDTFPDTYTVLDIETTGFDPSNDKILEIGALKVFNGNIVEEFEHLIYCEAVPPYISSLTGIDVYKRQMRTMASVRFICCLLAKNF